MTTLERPRHDRRNHVPPILWSLAVLMFGLLVLWRYGGTAAAPTTFNVEVVSAPASAQPGSTVTISWRLTGDENVSINKLYFGYSPCNTFTCYSYSTTNQPGPPGQYTATLAVDATIYFRVVAGTGPVTKETSEQTIRVPQVFPPYFTSSRAVCYPWAGDVVTATWSINTANLPFDGTSFHWDTASQAERHEYANAPPVTDLGANQYRATLTVPDGVEAIFGATSLEVNNWSLWSGESSLAVGPGRFLGFRPLPPYLPRGRPVEIGWEADAGHSSSSVQSALLYDTVSHAGAPALGSYPFLVENYGGGAGGSVTLNVPTEGERLFMRAYIWDYYNCMAGNNESPEIWLPIQNPLEVTWQSVPAGASRGSTITVGWNVAGKQNVGLTRVEADLDGDNYFDPQEYWSPNQSGGMGVYTAEVPVPLSASTLRLRALASDGIVYYSEIRTIPLSGDQQTPTPTATRTPTATATATPTPTPTATARPDLRLWLPVLVR